MVRVVLDANVVVSSVLIQVGNPAIILKMLISGEIQNSTTPEIIDEIKDVLERPRISKRINPLDQEFILHAFEEFSEKINPGITFAEVKDDPDDNKILECAVSAGVSYIISGDDHLLNLGEYKSIKILSPHDFVLLIEKGRGKYDRIE